MTPAPISQVCIKDGVGFIFEYRRTMDVYRRLPGGDYGSAVVYPAGSGWFMVRRYPDNTTLWRRVQPWVGKLSPWWRA